MAERFCLLTCAIFIVSGSLCVFGLDKTPLDANEIIRRYRESLSYAECISVKIDMEIHGTDETLSDFEQSFIRSRQTNIVYRRDHDRTEWIGNRLVLDQKGIVDASKSFVMNEVMTGEYDGHVIGKLNELPILATISKDYQDRQKALFNDPEHGGVLFGKIFGNNHKSVAELLAGATELRLRDVQQDIGDTSCYVLEATTEYGKVTAWIAPEKGYNALKWTIHKTSGDIYDEKPLFTSLTSWTAVFDDVELQKVDDMFITTGGTWTHTRNSTDGHTLGSHFKYKVGEVDLNPDFEALGAFVFNVPDGTRVSIKEFPGVGYIWSKDKKFVVDEHSGSIMYVPKGWQLLVHIGKALPGLNALKLDLKSEQIKGKRMLICFWDMQQRPSRNCLIQLNKRVQELQEKDVIIVAIQASKIDENALNEWIKKQNVSFPVGMIHSDEKQTRFNWGVRSLPWMILTDENHIVTAEGFSIDGGN